MPESPASKVPAADTPAETKPAAPAPPPKGTMKLKFHMEKPEIMMIENPMNLDTNALVLDIAVDFKMLISPEVQTMQGAISGLQVISCIYAEEKREASKAQVGFILRCVVFMLSLFFADSQPGRHQPPQQRSSGQRGAHGHHGHGHHHEHFSCNDPYHHRHTEHHVSTKGRLPSVYIDSRLF
jgi:hypothetical protein